MPTGKYTKDHPMTDIIPLEGAFASAFLPDAPPLYVKLYIFLLHLCSHPEKKFSGPGELAQALGCADQDISAGLAYWAELGLLHYSLRPFWIEIDSAREAAKQHNAYAPNALHVYADYFAALRALFPDRNLSPSEYDKGRDWLEVYGLSQEVALMMVNHVLANMPKGKKITFAYIDKVALSWAEDNIKTAEAAEEYLQLYEARQHQAGKVLLHLGIKRVPTMDEIRLYEKWAKKQGFTHESVIVACREMTKTVNPSFAYLDKILQSLDALQLHEAKEIKKHLESAEANARLLSSLLHELGLRTSAATPELQKWVSRFLAAGFTQESLTFVAKSCARDGLRSFKKYAERLLWWQEKEIFTPAAMEQYKTAHPEDKPADFKKEQNNQTPTQIKQTNFHVFNRRTDIDFEKLYTDLDTLEDLV